MAKDITTDVTPQVSTWVQQLKELAINNGLNCVYAIVILVVGIWFAGIFGRGLTKFMTNRKIDPTISKFVGNIIKYGIIAFVVIAALGRIGIATASFVAVLGAAGLAIGLALQGSLSNFSTSPAAEQKVPSRRSASSRQQSLLLTTKSSLFLTQRS